jgi:hypothetical protein
MLKRFIPRNEAQLGDRYMLLLLTIILALLIVVLVLGHLYGGERQPEQTPFLGEDGSYLAGPRLLTGVRWTPPDFCCLGWR